MNTTQKLSDTISRKFVETFEIDEWEVLSDTGYVPITHSNKTIEYRVYSISLENGTTIQCADDHIFIDEYGNELFAKDSLYHNLITKNGLSRVINVSDCGYSENMYDLTVDSDDHTYYTNGILSHNTTVATIILLHFALFNSAKRIGLLSNKADSSREILDRIQMAYENLPQWMQIGVKEWNKGSVEFANESRIIAAASSSSSIRGKAMAFLYIDETAFLENWTDFYASTFPTISSGKTTKMLFTSCVTKDTLVYTDKGLKRIEDFVDTTKIGGYYVPEYNVQGHTKIRKSNIFHNDGLKKTKILKTKSGTIEASLAHKFWAYKKETGYGWYKSEDLSVGDYLSTHANYNLWGNWVDCSDFKPKASNYIKNTFSPNLLTPDLCYLIGLYVAEGSCYKEYDNDVLRSCQFTITCGDDISSIFNSLGIKYACYDGLHYTFTSYHFMEFMEYLGFDLSNTASKKSLPTKLLSTTKKNISALLAGMFDGDGCIIIKNGHSRVSYTSTSKELIKQVKMLLLNYGIFSSVYDKKTPPTKKVKVWSYSQCIELNARDSIKFNDEIGFRLKRKFDRIVNETTLRNGSPSDIIPDAYNIMKEFGVKCFNDMHIPKHSNISRYKMIEIKSHLESCGYNGNDKLIKFFENNISEHIRWEAIKEIKDSEAEVYDFSLPDNDADYFAHSVVYNGFIGHQTPNGLNHYYDFWKGATEGTVNEQGVVEKNGFVPIFAPWYKIPGRDDKWKQDTLKALNYDFDRFRQEYEGEFLGSSGTLLNSSTLGRLVPSPTITSNEFLKQYELPQKDRVYFMTCDVSRGKGLDYSAFSVFDVTEVPYKQVCTFRNNRITPTDYASWIYRIAKLYNEAFVIIETNDLGEQVAVLLQYDYGYENTLSTESAGRAGKRISSGFGRGAEIGIRTTTTVKRLGCSVLKLMLEQNTLVLTDDDTIKELRTFSKKNDSYAAEPGKHDDMVMTLVLLAFLTQDSYFHDLANGNILPLMRDQSDDDIDNDLLPFGYVNGGKQTDEPTYVKFKGEKGVWEEKDPEDSFRW